MTDSINFNDSIYNGVLFSEVCANLLRENRDLIKEVSYLSYSMFNIFI